LQVLVRDNNVDQALRVLKKKMQREGMFAAARLREAVRAQDPREVRGDSARPQACAQEGAARGPIAGAPRKKPLDDKRGGRPGMAGGMGERGARLPRF
jgi:ribosomal protein S21